MQTHRTPVPNRTEPIRHKRERFKPRDGRRYLAFNKPYAVLSQFTQPAEGGKRTLSEFGFPPGVYSIGRLDYDSEGLLLLSDDPALNNYLLAPDRAHPRTYLVQVDGIPTAAALRRLAEGVEIEGRRTRPAIAELLPEPPDLPERSVPIRVRKAIPTAWISLTLTEGRNRQVRRMTAAVGYPTLRLVRRAIGALTLDALRLEPGRWRPLDSTALALVLQH